MDIPEKTLYRWVSALAGTNYRPASKIYNEIRTLLKMHGTGRPQHTIASATCAECPTNPGPDISANDSAPRTCETCDIDRDALTIDRAIRYPDHFPGISNDASEALQRLVAIAKAPRPVSAEDVETALSRKTDGLWVNIRIGRQRVSLNLSEIFVARKAVAEWDRIAPQCPNDCPMDKREETNANKKED